MLTNSVIAGGVAAGYLTVLVLQVNPQYPVAASAVLPLALMLGAAYGLNLTAVFYGTGAERLHEVRLRKGQPVPDCRRPS